MNARFMSVSVLQNRGVQTLIVRDIFVTHKFGER